MIGLRVEEALNPKRVPETAQFAELGGRKAVVRVAHSFECTGRKRRTRLPRRTQSEGFHARLMRRADGVRPGYLLRRQAAPVKGFGAQNRS
jgi:hypothetical protein